jgi:hypothetical protein
MAASDPIRFIPAFLVFATLCAENLHSQSPGRDLFLTGGLNIGTIGWSPSKLSGKDSEHFSRIVNFGIGKIRNNAGNKRLRIIANTSIGVHAGFMWKDRSRINLNGLQLEFQSNKASYAFKPPFQYTYKGDTLVAWVDADNYLKYSLSVVRSWNLPDPYRNDYSFWYTRLSFGHTFYHTSFGERYQPSEDWTENGTGMRQTAISLSESSYMVSPEIGYRFMLENGHIIDFGVVYHQPFRNTRVVEYEFFRQGVSLGKSRITFPGSTVMLNLSYTFVHKLKRRPSDSSDVKDRYLAMVDSVESSANTFNHRKLNGRRYRIQETMTVSNASVTLAVWDKNRVDGDEISLYLNGEPVLETYTVSKTKKDIVINLRPGSNTIVMEALNLGKVPPNTAAIGINDGSTKKIVTLVSDLKQSGALEIIYEP